MAALFVSLFKMPLQQLSGKQVSQNVAQSAKNIFLFHPTNMELSLKTKFMKNWATLGKGLNFCQFGLYFCDISDNIIAAMEF